MNEKILVVDDDFGVLKLLETILSNKYEVKAFKSSVEAYENFKKEEYDCIISDFFMPEMDGRKFLNAIRQLNQLIPFIIITTNTEIKTVVDLMKEGANDYIVKPIVEEDLVYRVAKTIDITRNKQIAERISKEKEILELERKRLVDWKILYAVKDIKQTEKVIHMITRNINQGGAYVWLELLKNNIKKINDKTYEIKKSLVNLIIKTSEENQRFFNVITYLSQMDTEEFNIVNMSSSDLIRSTIDYFKNELTEIASRYNREIKYEISNEKIQGMISIDIKYFRKILLELFMNSIKYSPDKSPIIFGFEKNRNMQGKNLDIIIKNRQRQLNAKDTEGNVVVGIPFEYSELIFDLFYTIEAFPFNYEEEEWINGTGLYISRKIMKKFNGWLRTANEVNYTTSENLVLIKFVATLPVK